MSNITTAINLYTMMVTRMEESTFCPNQAAVYRQTIELIKDCATAEEAMHTIKQSPLYLAPTTAIVKDKIRALMLAAEQNDMPDVAEVYRNKLAEIDLDNNTINDTAHHQKALRLKTRHLQQMQAFSSIYCNYLDFKASGLVATPSELTPYIDMKKAFDELKANGGKFHEVAQKPHFRALIRANDEGYKLFLSEAHSLLTSLPDHSSEIKSLSDEANAQFAKIKEHKSEIMAHGNTAYINRGKASEVIIAPPADKNHPYTFINEEIRP